MLEAFKSRILTACWENDVQTSPLGSKYYKRRFYCSVARFIARFAHRYYLRTVLSIGSKETDVRITVGLRSVYSHKYILFNESVRVYRITAAVGKVLEIQYLLIIAGSVHDGSANRRIWQYWGQIEVIHSCEANSKINPTKNREVSAQIKLSHLFPMRESSEN